MYARLRCGGNLPLCLAFGTGVLGVLWWLGGWHSVPETGLYGTEYACRAQNRLPGVRDAFSEAFGAKNRLLRYRRDIRCMTPPLSARKAFS